MQNTTLKITINDRESILNVSTAKLIPGFSHAFNNMGNIIQNELTYTYAFSRNESIDKFFKMLNILDDEIEGYRIIDLRFITDIFVIFSGLGIEIIYDKGIFSFTIGDVEHKYKINVNMEDFVNGTYTSNDIKFHDCTETSKRCRYSNTTQFDEMRDSTSKIKYLGTYIRFIQEHNFMASVLQFMTIKGDTRNIQTPIQEDSESSTDDSVPESPVRERRRRSNR